VSIGADPGAGWINCKPSDCRHRIDRERDHRRAEQPVFQTASAHGRDSV